MVSLMLGTLTDDLRALMHKSYRKTTRISYDFLKFLNELFEFKESWADKSTRSANCGGITQA